VGVGAHKRSVTVAVVDAVGGQLGAASFANSSSGVEEVVAWVAAAAPAVLRVGVEGSSGHGRHLAERLVAAGYDVREVPPGAPPSAAEPAAPQRPTTTTAARSPGRLQPSRRWGRSSLVQGWARPTMSW
jgi:transposase